MIIENIDGFEVKADNNDRYYGFFRKSDGWNMALLEEATDKLSNDDDDDDDDYDYDDDDDDDDDE